MITEPAVTLERVKAHLRVDHDADDDLILTYIGACTAQAEHVLGREIIKRSDENALAESKDDVPQAVAAWICLAVADMYEKRSVSESGLGQGRRNYDHLLDGYRIFSHEEEQEA